MADYFMDEETWESKKTLLNDWYEANPEYADRRAISDGLFKIGDLQLSRGRPLKGQGQ